MSEDEIIEEFKELIYNPDYDEILLCTEDGFTGWHELFKNVLDLYNKEKEKNKEYERQLDLDYVDKNYISKDKIREKQMYYEKMLREEKWGEKTELGFRNRIVALQELLEE